MDTRYETAHGLYVEGDRDGEDPDATYHRRTKAAMAMWLFAKSEGSAAERVLETIEAKPDGA
jgi:hypothetical protein